MAVKENFHVTLAWRAGTLQDCSAYPGGAYTQTGSSMDPPLKECKQSLARTAFHVFTFLPEKLQYTSLYASSCFIFLEMNLAKGNENDAKFCLKKSKTCINFSFKLCSWNPWNWGSCVLFGYYRLSVYTRGAGSREGGGYKGLQSCILGKT